MRTAARWTLATILTLFALIATNAAVAQTPVVRDCTAPATCTVVSDAISGTPGTVPTLCRLYNGGTMLMEVAAVAPYACTFTRSYPAGTYSLTARYATATQEGPDSNVVALISALPLPAPSNFRFQ